MRQLILPLGQELNIEDLKQVHVALRENSQIREAARMPSMICELFERTKTLPGSLDIWQEISDWLQSQARGGDVYDWYAYPELAARIAASVAQSL